MFDGKKTGGSTQRDGSTRVVCLVWQISYRYIQGPKSLKSCMAERRFPVIIQYVWSEKLGGGVGKEI